MPSSYKLWRNEKAIADLCFISKISIRDPDGNLVGLIQLEAFAHVLFQKGDLDAQDEADHQTALGSGKKIEDLPQDVLTLWVLEWPWPARPRLDWQAREPNEGRTRFTCGYLHKA